jgi:GNAT superfamily N-acetyltransferase
MQIKKLEAIHFQKIIEVLRSHQNENYFLSYGLDWKDSQLQGAIGTYAFGLWESEALISFIFLRSVNSALFELDLMATHKDMAHKNYMEFLFSESLKKLPSGAEIWLEVHQNNDRAQKFYEKHGFSVVGERPNYYPDGGKAILMTRKPSTIT